MRVALMKLMQRELMENTPWYNKSTTEACFAPLTFGSVKGDMASHSQLILAYIFIEESAL